MNSDQTPPPAVYVVDDDEAVRRGLTRLFRSSGYVVEAYASAAEFLGGLRPSGPACAVLDYQMPALNGLDLQAQMAAHGIHIPVIFLTGHGNVPTAVQALKGGAIDFMTKPYRANELRAAVAAAVEKDRAQRASAAEQEEVQCRLATLTGREREVLMLVVAGYLNKQIAAELGNSERTVKVHRARVMMKMKAQSVAQLTRMMERSGVETGQRTTP